MLCNFRTLLSAKLAVSLVFLPFYIAVTALGGQLVQKGKKFPEAIKIIPPRASRSEMYVDILKRGKGNITLCAFSFDTSLILCDWATPVILV